MDLYTLGPTFLAKDNVGEFASAIWTERYYAAGDVQLVLAANAKNLAMLAPGTFLALRGTNEVMQLATQQIEKSLVTVTGKALPAYLNQRSAWFRNPDDAATADQRVTDYTQTAKPGEFIADVVNKSVIVPVPFAGTFAPANLDWAREVIPNLTLGAVDASGVTERLTMAAGPLYDSIQRFAEPFGVGFTLYLESASPLGYSLKFTTYRGKDRTNSQAVNPRVLLSPNLDTVTGLKEIHSNELYKNVAYVYYQGIVSTHYADPLAPVPEGFDRRVLIVNPTTEPVGRPVVWPDYGDRGGRLRNLGTYLYVGPAELAAFRAQVAKDALANANYIRAIDGQTSPDSQYTYGRDFGLGDLIELEGLTGTISKARVTEYIRSQDQHGEKNYPTISVVA